MQLLISYKALLIQKDNHRECWNTGTQAKVRWGDGRQLRRARGQGANRAGQSQKETGRGASVLQSQAGNLCSRPDPELEFSILRGKPRIEGGVEESTDKMFEARTERSRSQKRVGKWNRR